MADTNANDDDNNIQNRDKTQTGELNSSPPAPAPTTAARKKARSILLNWRLWLALLIAALLIASGVSIATDPRSAGANGDISHSAFFVGIAFTVGLVWSGIEIVLKFLGPLVQPLWEKVQGLDKKTAQIDNATRDNTSNITVLGAAYRELVDEYQQFREENRGEMSQLQKQVNEFLHENVALNRTIIKMEREMSDIKQKLVEAEIRHEADQREITILRAQLEDMKLEFVKLNTSNDYLSAENKELKTTLGRRSTDKLTMSEEAEARYNDIQQQQQQQETEVVEKEKE